MNKIVKKLLILVSMTLGALAVTKPASAHDYVSSTWTAQFVAFIATTGPTGVVPTTYTLGGVTPGGSFDISRIWLSTGYSNGAYFVCVDSIPLQTGYSLANFPNEQYLFPPIPFVTSTATVFTGQMAVSQMVDFRDYQGGGRTVKNGLLCFVQGDSTNRYWWQIETVETPMTTERR